MELGRRKKKNVSQEYKIPHRSVRSTDKKRRTSHVSLGRQRRLAQNAFDSEYVTESISASTVWKWRWFDDAREQNVEVDAIVYVSRPTKEKF